jgi:hypothetical protein
MIDFNNIPELLQKAIQQYTEVGYAVMQELFTKEQVELAIKEWNYHTTSRNVDLFDSSTWQNVKDQHDWSFGWAKWLYTTGIQVCT